MTAVDDAPTPVEPPKRSPHPNGLTAAATRLTSYNIDRLGSKKGNAAVDDRGKEAWELYRLVGEQRFLANTLAGRVGQAMLYIGKLNPNDPDGVPDPLADDDPNKERLEAVLKGFGRTPAERSQILTRAGLNLFVAGDGWFVGIPRDVLKRLTTKPDPTAPLPIVDRNAPVETATVDVSSLMWRFMSRKEVETTTEEKVKLHLGAGDGGTLEVSPDEILMIRCWRPDPETWWNADSPVLSSLPVLRELVGLTMHVSAQVDSRLAGAGILLVSSQAKEAVLRAAGVEPENEDDDPFTDALIEAMVTSISDRSNASAVVPLVVTIPLQEGQSVDDHMKLLTFHTPLDSEARQLREEAIRRLALGEDAPPELLLGMATMNHWGAWLVKEDVITTHVEPPLALMCDALTSEYLWPVLTAVPDGDPTAPVIDDGARVMSDEEAQQYVIWYSVQHLVARPDRLKDAMTLHEAGLLADDVVRLEAGYSDEDAPEVRDPAVQMVLEMIVRAPSLAQDPGLPVLAEQIREMLAGKVPETVAPEADAGDDPSGEEGPPATSPEDEPAADDSEPIAASAVGPDYGGWQAPTETLYPFPEPERVP